MKSRPLTIALALCLLGAMLAVASPAAAAGNHPSRADGPSSLLFVQQTRAGELARVGPGLYRLVFRGVSPTVATFTDRPRRRAGEQSVAGFVHGWAGNGFAADPPNAALVLRGVPSSHDVAMLTLSHPRYDRRAQRLTYTAKPLHGSSATSLAGFSRRGDPLQPLSFENASLFVDDAGATSFVPITFTVSLLGPQTQETMITIDPESSLRWSIGGPNSRRGFHLGPLGPYPIPNLNLNVTPTTLSFSTQGTEGTPTAFTLALYLEGPDAFFLGSAVVGAGVNLQANVNGIETTLISGEVNLPLE